MAYMNHTNKIEELSQTMRSNRIKTLEIKDLEGEIKIELFSIETADKCISQHPKNLEEIQAPLMGIGYLKSSDNDIPLVSVGDKVKKGEILCIIEKMKVMNEIAADNNYEICEVCIEDGKIVEFGQVLFRVKRIDE